MSSRAPSCPLVLPSSWPELERIEHPLAWVDAAAALLADNAAFRRRRGEADDPLGWILGSDARRALAEALVCVAGGGEPRRTVEMASPGDRWEALTVHAIPARPGTALLEIQDVTRRRLEERRLAVQSLPIRALVGERAPLRAADAFDAAAPAPTSLAAVEKMHVSSVLAASGHCVSRAAAELGISRSTLYATMRRHGIAIPPAAARRRRR